jgi:hypothetical protein
MPPWGVHPELEKRARSIHTVAVARPDVKIYQLTAGGMTELMDDWCEKGERNMTAAVSQILAKRSVKTRLLTIDAAGEGELEDVSNLFSAIAYSINLHTLQTPEMFPEKRLHFEYSVGSLDRLLRQSNADALLLLYGYDEISTGGRKALMAVSSVFGIVTGNAGPHKGVTVVAAGLFDRSGALLWYDDLGAAGGFDLRDSDSMEQAMESLLTRFPRLGK